MRLSYPKMSFLFFSQNSFMDMNRLQKCKFCYELFIFPMKTDFFHRWALKHGHVLIGGLSAATGAYINSYYRKKLKLGNFGQLSSYLPIVVIPTIISMVAHKGLVTKEIMLKPNACSTCLEIRSSFIQAGFGVVYPTIMAPLAAFMFATRYFTYRLPDITENPKEVLQLWRKLTKPLVSRITALVCFHGIAAILITHLEFKHFYKMQTKFNEELKD